MSLTSPSKRTAIFPAGLFRKKTKSGKPNTILAKRTSTKKAGGGFSAEGEGLLAVGAEWIEVGHSRPSTGTEVFNLSLAEALAKRAESLRSKSQDAAHGEAGEKERVKVVFSKSETEKLLQHFDAEVIKGFCP